MSDEAVESAEARLGTAIKIAVAEDAELNALHKTPDHNMISTFTAAPKKYIGSRPLAKMRCRHSPGKLE